MSRTIRMGKDLKNVEKKEKTITGRKFSIKTTNKKYEFF